LRSARATYVEDVAEEDTTRNPHHERITEIHEEPETIDSGDAGPSRGTEWTDFGALEDGTFRVASAARNGKGAGRAVIERPKPPSTRTPSDGTQHSPADNDDDWSTWGTGSKRKDNQTKKDEGGKDETKTADQAGPPDEAGASNADPTATTGSDIVEVTEYEGALTTTRHDDDDEDNWSWGSNRQDWDEWMRRQIHRNPRER
jgi:hypothetical protein